MKTFLIVYSPTNNITELQARIRSLGDSFSLWIITAYCQFKTIL